MKKLRLTLTAINEEIKGLEKEHQNQVDQISAQKRLYNVSLKYFYNRQEEKRKKDDLKEELARDK